MRYLRFHFPGVNNIQCMFGTRLGGSSSGQFSSGNISFEVGDEETAVLNNRLSMKDELGFERLVELRQVHGTDMHFDPQGDYFHGSGIEGDGAGVSGPRTAVMIKTADCQPVFLVHKSGRYVCALHVGWRGNRVDFPGRGVKLFCEHYALSPGELQAVRGPSLGPCCARFHVFEEHWSREFFGYYLAAEKTMDLWAMTRDQLHLAGIPRNSIHSMDMCTRCRGDLFFSYRREKICGRQANFIFIKGAGM